MKDRIKAIRKALKLTQAEFGASIGVKGNTITNYETGLRMPSDAVILSICREFGVNETWLRTGEGEMFVKKSRDDEIAGFVGEVLSEETPTFKKRLISVLARLSEDEWSMLENRLKEIVGEQEGTKKD